MAALVDVAATVESLCVSSCVRDDPPGSGRLLFLPGGAAAGGAGAADAVALSRVLPPFLLAHAVGPCPSLPFLQRGLALLLLLHASASKREAPRSTAPAPLAPPPTPLQQALATSAARRLCAALSLHVFALLAALPTQEGGATRCGASTTPGVAATALSALRLLATASGGAGSASGPASSALCAAGMSALCSFCFGSASALLHDATSPAGALLADEAARVLCASGSLRPAVRLGLLCRGVGDAPGVFPALRASFRLAAAATASPSLAASASGLSLLSCLLSCSGVHGALACDASARRVASAAAEAAVTAATAVLRHRSSVGVTPAAPGAPPPPPPGAPTFPLSLLPPPASPHFRSAALAALRAARSVAVAASSSPQRAPSPSWAGAPPPDLDWLAPARRVFDAIGPVFVGCLLASTRGGGVPGFGPGEQAAVSGALVGLMAAISRTHRPPGVAVGEAMVAAVAPMDADAARSSLRRLAGAGGVAAAEAADAAAMLEWWTAQAARGDEGRGVKRGAADANGA